MRILLISDIHANLTALDAVLAEAGKYDELWCLGDIVGYGPDPNECIERLASIPNLVCLIGNHDAAALGNIDLDSFNREARYSTRWTQAVLTPSSQQFLKSLPERIVVSDITLAHGSPRSPIWEYLLDPVSAYENLTYFQTDVCFFGHTHVPIAFRLVENKERMRPALLRDGDTPELTSRMMLNPGSIGQPRDHDPRAAFAVFNPETRLWKSCRIPYDVESVQRRMVKADLPARLIHRLGEGW